MIDNGFVALGPNVTGYPGGYPNGYFNFLKKKGWWKAKRLHVCSGSVKDGTTIDIKPETNPTIVCDVSKGIPLRDNTFDAIYIDPPYSQEKAEELYALPLLSVPALLKEAARVVRHDGLIILFDLRVWMPPPGTNWVAMYACYLANRGPKPLRCIQVWRKKPRPLGAYDKD